MGYFEKREDIEYIHTRKKTIEERLYLLEKKIDIIIKELNNKK